MITSTGMIICIKIVTMIAGADSKEQFSSTALYAMLITNLWTAIIICKTELLSAFFMCMHAYSTVQWLTKWITYFSISNIAWIANT